MKTDSLDLELTIKDAVKKFELESQAKLSEQKEHYEAQIQERVEQTIQTISALYSLGS